MSFLHNVRVGFFGPQWAGRELKLEECKALLVEFQTAVPSELNLEVCQELRGNPDRGVILAYSDGFPVIFKRGTLTCPYLATEYQYSAIAFALFMHLSSGSEIYSDDEGRFLMADELIPKVPFSDVLREFLAAINEKK